MSETLGSAVLDAKDKTVYYNHTFRPTDLLYTLGAQGTSLNIYIGITRLA